MNFHKYILPIFFILLLCTPATSQVCQSGNCINGIGKMLLPDGNTYEGDFKDGKREGKGMLTMLNGDTYNGAWKGDRRNGQGTWKRKNGEWYEGTWKNNARYGEGLYTWADGSTYIGEWYSDMRYGKGSMTYASGNSYKGNWEDGSFHGKGAFEWKGGMRFVGIWDENRPTEGILYFPDGERFQGNWTLRKENGKSLGYFYSSKVLIATWEGDSLKDNRSQRDQFERSVPVDAADYQSNNYSAENEKVIQNAIKRKQAEGKSKEDPLESFMKKYNGDFDLVMRELESQKQILAEKGLRIREEMERIAERLQKEKLDEEQKVYLQEYLNTLEASLIDTELALQEAIAHTSAVIARMKRTISDQSEEITVINEEKAQQESNYQLLSIIAAVAICAVAVMFFIARAINKQRKEMMRQKAQIEKQKAEIEKQNQDITASINYASRIQKATLPTLAEIRAAFPESFVFFRPRDIVSGDFYWFAEEDGKIFIAVADCTGHGVPGAFMSLVGTDLLNDIILTQGIHRPDLVLEELHLRVSLGLRQEETSSQDGMDIAFCVIHKQDKKMEFAGAKSSLFMMHHGLLTELRGDRFPIGGFQKKEAQHFALHTLSLQPHQTFYLSSDGYRDQFGGPNQQKLTKSGFKKVLEGMQHLPVQEQEHHLEAFLSNWMRKQRQLDDILVVGFKA